MSPEASLLGQVVCCAVGGWATGKLLVVLTQLAVDTAWRRRRRSA